MKNLKIVIAMPLLYCFVHGQSPAKKELTPETKQFVQYWKQVANLSDDLVKFKKETGVSLQPRLDEESKKSLPKLYQAFDELLNAAMGNDNSQSTITEKFNLKAIQNSSSSGLSAYSPIEDENKPLPLMPNGEILAVKTTVTPDLKNSLPENKINLADYNINVRLAKVDVKDNNKALYDELTKQILFSTIIYKKWIGDYQKNNKNLLLFVNGYRTKMDLTLAEYPNSNNKVYSKDLDGYWEGIDAKFIDRISTKNTVYADGHHSVATANHLSQLNFGCSFASSEVACGTSAVTSSLIGASLNPILGAKIIANQIECFHNPECVTLNTTPNTTGFNQRRESGRTAGKDLYQKLINGTIPCRKALINGEVKIQDTIDIVCHSMGFAYTLGILDELKTKIAHFGWLYCIAPENGCSGEVPLNTSGQSLFDEVWQYGSNELPVEQGGDVMWEQDGIAPQCGIKGLANFDKNLFGRVYIPQEVPKGFMPSHQIKNYGWILQKSSNERGYVKKRN